MKRRTFLAAIPSTVLIAGCVTNDAKPTNDTDDENRDPYNQPAQYDEVKHLTVRNSLNESINATIVVRDLDTGTVLSETNITTPEPREDERAVRADKSIPTADESGNYTAAITIEGRGTVTTEFDLRTPVSDPVLYIGLAPNDGEPFGAGVDGAPAV
ncbi:hypothetical protein HT576_11450 [Haloterrigena sp. SYSU A121-1]|uniref:Uncharacterized protein n=1 Tax=Haloterrigena gelatinilytica TaxID=2741724 RepID=A0A8J8GNP3_9EURY|nr:hypothetical protein [Haloterrigena gelatinilytica]NUB91629.1 hypothetical protein [Haloterrigena gelatinilytica]